MSFSGDSSDIRVPGYLELELHFDFDGKATVVTISLTGSHTQGWPDRAVCFTGTPFPKWRPLLCRAASARWFSAHIALLPDYTGRRCEAMRSAPRGLRAALREM